MHLNAMSSSCTISRRWHSRPEKSPALKRCCDGDIPNGDLSLPPTLFHYWKKHTALSRLANGYCILHANKMQPGKRRVCNRFALQLTYQLASSTMMISL